MDDLDSIANKYGLGSGGAPRQRRTYQRLVDIEGGSHGATMRNYAIWGWLMRRDFTLPFLALVILGACGYMAATNADKLASMWPSRSVAVDANEWPAVVDVAPVSEAREVAAVDMVFALDAPWMPGAPARVRLGDGRLVCLAVAHPDDIGAMVYAAMRGEMELAPCE